jgi:hypothetical protein
MDSWLNEFRKQHSIVGHLFAQEIGRQTPHRPTENCQKVKISFGSHWIISSSIHADEFPLKKPPEDFIPQLAEASRKMRGIPLRRDKPSI